MIKLKEVIGRLVNNQYSNMVIHALLASKAGYRYLAVITSSPRFIRQPDGNLKLVGSVRYFPCYDMSEVNGFATNSLNSVSFLDLHDEEVLKVLQREEKKL